jgi:hypothetical protein
MEWLSDRELDTLDDFLRGDAGAGSGPAFLATIDGLLALCRAYPRLAHEVRALRGEAQRLRQTVAQTSAEARTLESELKVARATIAGLEGKIRKSA